MSEEPGTLQSRCQGAWAGREQSSTPEGSHLGWEGQVLPRNRGHRGWDWRCETNRLRGIGTMSTQPTHGCSQWVQEKPSTHHSLVWGLQTQGSLGPKKPELQLGERGAWWSMCSVTQSCPTLRDPMDCSPPASFVHGIVPASIPDPVRRYELIWKRTEPTRKRSWNEGLRDKGKPGQTQSETIAAGKLILESELVPGSRGRGPATDMVMPEQDLMLLQILLVCKASYQRP